MRAAPHLLHCLRAHSHLPNALQLQLPLRVRRWRLRRHQLRLPPVRLLPRLHSCRGARCRQRHAHSSLLRLLLLPPSLLALHRELLPLVLVQLRLLLSLLPRRAPWPHRKPPVAARTAARPLAMAGARAGRGRQPGCNLQHQGVHQLLLLLLPVAVAVTVAGAARLELQVLLQLPLLLLLPLQLDPVEPVLGRHARHITVAVQVCACAGHGAYGALVAEWRDVKDLREPHDELELP